MKIACIGNMNNMLFSLTRYLRDRGFETDLLCQPDEIKHFRPENDSFTDSYQSFVSVLSWGAGDAAMLKTTSVEKIRSDLSKYDFIIVTGVALAFLAKAKIRADVFFPAGTDIKYLPFRGEKMRWDQRVRNYKSYRLFENQKIGIKNATIINMEHSIPFWDEPIEKLRIRSKTFYFACPMVYEPQYNRVSIQEHYPSSSRYSHYKKIRETCDVLIVNQTRQLWISHGKIGHPSKGSDKLILGFSKFIKETHANARLVLFENGGDVDASKKLIDELNIADHIIWEPLTSRKEIMVLLSMADFACGEFSQGHIGGGTVWEALVSNSCLLHYLDTNYNKFDNFFTSPYPFVNVKNENDISDVFCDYLKRPEFYKKIAASGNEWYKNNFGKRSVDIYVELIKAKKENGNLINVLNQLL